MTLGYRLIAPDGWDRVPLDDRAERAVGRTLFDAVASSVRWQVGDEPAAADAVTS
ncbi:hypothetical protein K8Z61_10785 [Nocardioides sp. TRM66260-LWL]|uniref:hypothetical protein n=1 Tax=Nocardioides sp. TRM66260-LWL TaxID=2874478 RepID=UPI001CC3849D|nr:hypothetical protein [Nocardioides sp. TRM66260-LWL]MBZ5734983.1 hypothetical protein [Nocardioides sp. TRM66260-LWL]